MRTLALSVAALVALVACSDAAPSSPTTTAMRCAASDTPTVALGFGLGAPVTLSADDEVTQVFGPQGGSHVWVGGRAGGLATPVEFSFEARDAFSGARIGTGRAVGGCEVRSALLYLNALFPGGAGLARVRVTARDTTGRSATSALRVWIGPRHPECVPQPGATPSLVPLVLTSLSSRREEALTVAPYTLLRPASGGDALIGAGVLGFAASAVTLFARLYEDTPAGRVLVSELRASPSTDDTNVVPVVRRASPECVAPVTVRLPIDATVPRGPLVLQLTADDGLGHRSTEERPVLFAPEALDAAVLDAPETPPGGSSADAAADGVAWTGDRTPLPPGPGLTPLGSGNLSAAAHSRELTVDGDLVFVADSNGLPVLRMAADGRVAVVHPIAVPREQHCSTTSLHARSRTLVCGAGDTGTLDLIDVHDPAAPRSRLWSINDHDARGQEPVYQVHDVEVSGDTLWMAAQHNGLLRSTLGGDGMPLDLVRTGRGVNVVGVVAGGGRLALIDRARGLMILSEGALSLLGSAPLDGPPLDVTMDGDRVAVALGSEGARVFRIVDGVPTELARVQPRCVATAVALSGDELAVSCLTGVTLYDLSVTPPRVVGYHAAQYGMLDVAFTPRGLLVSDWYLVSLLATNPWGFVDYPDVPRALRLAPARDARLVVRNPAQTPMTARWRLVRFPGVPVAEGALTIPASGDAALTVPYAQLEAAGSREGSAYVVFYTGPTAPLPGAGGAYTSLFTRLATELPERGFVGIGDRFPTLRRTVASAAPSALPLAGAATLMMFLTVDCYLQWAQIEDMAWSRAHGMTQPTPTVLYLTTRDKDPFDPRLFMAAHGAADLPTVEWADYARSVPGQEAEANPVRAFEMSFMMRTPGADFPHDYRVAADGTTTDTMRMYRGHWPLNP